MIRKAEKKDASRIAEILIFTKRTAYRSIFNNDKVSFGEMQVLPLALQLQNNADMLNGYYVYDDEFVKGIICLKANDNEIEIKELYIDSFFKGLGIGSELVKFADSFKVDTISLWVLEKNLAARSFYEKNGFINLKERKIEEGTEEYILKYCKKTRAV